MTKPIRTKQPLILLLLFVSEVSLGDPLWRDFSAAYVAGSGFTLDPVQQQTLSLEYASGYRWGDTFTYLDTTFFRDDERTYSLFGETAARKKVVSR